ncbi:MAG: YwiC-like family protein, partial [Acidobacteriia bacterium]|nr:YwiC-like family protein [Terriglobia bacterium]
MATAILHPTQQDSGQIFVPREHGATAMLLTPFFAAAILLRSIYWQEVVVLIAIVCAFAIKDPLVVIARQRLVWKQPHAETKAAVRSAVIEFWLMIACGIALLATRDWRPLVALFAGAAGFTAVAVRLTVRNRQRSEWFQVASAVGLSSTSIAACLAAVGEIPQWCWMLWLLSAL